MLFKNLNLKDPTVIASLKLTKLRPLSTWKEFHQAFAYALYKIMESGIGISYPYNTHGRAILFLMRHTLELQLKNELDVKGKVVPITHNFVELANEWGGVDKLPQEIRDLIVVIDRDFDGSCYRYARDPSTGNLFFDYKERLETASYFDIHEAMVAKGTFGAQSISPPLNFKNKGKQWDLTFIMGDSNTLWHIRAQYTGLAEILLSGIIDGSIDSQLAYLPLLFLIRHSLELALKANILQINEIHPGIYSEVLIREHKLSQLFTVYNNFLNGLDLTKMDSDTQIMLKELREKYISLNTTIHDLDVHSRMFRFPFDKKAKSQAVRLDRLKFPELVELYYFTDKFLSFTNEVLAEEGVIVLAQ